jgi:hypothetical protein
MVIHSSFHKEISPPFLTNIPNCTMCVHPLNYDSDSLQKIHEIPEFEDEELVEKFKLYNY